MNKSCLFFKLCQFEVQSLNFPRKEKFLEETLAGFNSDDVKATLRGLRYFKMTLPLLQVLQKSLPIPLSLCHTQ